MKDTIFAYPLEDSSSALRAHGCREDWYLTNQLPSWILSQSLFLHLRRLQLFPGSSFWISLLLRFQYCKNIPYVSPWLLLIIVILLLATDFSSFICYLYHVCYIFATCCLIYFLHTASKCGLQNYAYYLLHIFLYLFFLHLFLPWFPATFIHKIIVTRNG